MKRLIKKSGPLLLVFALAGTGLKAQGDSLTLEQAIATALENNYDILLSREDSASLSITQEYRNAVFLPTLNANSTILFNRNNQTQKLPDGTERKRNGIRTNNLNAALSLNWTLFDGFRMFIARERLDLNSMRGNWVIKNQVVNTVAQVIIAYYDIVRQTSILRNFEEQMLLSADRLRLAQYRLDIGVGIRPDVLQAQIDHNTRMANRLNQLSLIDQRKQELNRLMNVDRDVQYRVSDTIAVRDDLVLGNLLGNLPDVSPALRLARTNLELAQLDVRDARASRFPTVSLISAYNFSRNSNNAVVNNFTPLFSLNRGFNYGFTASVPIFNRFQVRQQIRQNELAVRFRTLEVENQQAQLNTGILTNYRQYLAQKEIIAIHDSSVALARENLAIERERYRLGATTFIELRTAEENLANAINNAIAARYATKLAETELLRLRGDLVR